MTNEEAVEQVKLLKALTGYDKDNPIVQKMQTALDMAIKALESHQNLTNEEIYQGFIELEAENERLYDALESQQPITWIVGKDNCQVAVRNMPIDKMQKICAIIEEEQDETKMHN